MLTSTGDYPATSVAGLEDNTLADGLFHSLTFIASLAGLWLLWGAVRKGAVLAGRHLAGLMLAGWGLFNLVEGTIDHQILTIHHVKTDNVVLWDISLPRPRRSSADRRYVRSRAVERKPNHDPTPADEANPRPQPSTPVASCGAPTGLDSGEPRWRRYTAKIAIEPTARNSDCQF